MKKLSQTLRNSICTLGILCWTFLLSAQDQLLLRKGQNVKQEQSSSAAPTDKSVDVQQKILEKFPEEASESDVPNLKEAAAAMSNGQKFNLKKIIKKNVGKELFTNKNDNPRLREEYNNQRLRNPNTGLIPKDIRKNELEYVHSPASKLQRDPFLFKPGTESTLNDPGTILSSWVNRGPFNVGGRTRALALDIDDENIILAGGVSGGMWRSTDQGLNWTKVTAPDQHPTVTDVVQDTRLGFHDTWYYGTGERLGSSQNGRNGSAFLQGNGIYKSIDNGLTWSVLTATQNTAPQSFDNPFDLIFGLAIHPTTGDLYVATFDGIQRSTDGGTSFSEVLGADFDNFSAIHITGSGVIYATLDDNGSQGGIFRSTDGGSGTWTDITDPGFPSSFGRTEIASAPSDNDVLYVISDGTGSSPVDHDFWKYTYVSGDGSGSGGTWENRTANLPNIGGSVGDFDSQGGYDLYVHVHPTDPDFVLIGGTNMYRSTDGFATANNTDWVAGYSPLNNISLYTDHHPDQHSLVFVPSNPNKVISGHDGGLSVTNDITTDIAGVEPVDWTSLNNGYLTTQVYALSFGPDDQIMAGFQDNSTWFTSSSDGTADWTDLFSGDGAYNAFNDEGNVRYMSSQNGNVFKVTYFDGNSTSPTNFTSIRPNGSTGFLFINPFELDPNTDEIMYFAGGNTLWRNDQLSNATATTGWTELTNASVSNSISTIGISTTPANVVYFGTTGGEVRRIDDAHTGNPTGVDVSSGSILPSGNVSCIAVDPSNSNNVYLTFSNYGIPSVFHSIDAGANWTDISGNLEVNPDGSGAGPSVRWLDIVGNSDIFLLGTSTGLYSTQTIDGSSTVWTQVDPNGIGNAVVEQLRSREDGLVVVGTHGNGLFSANYAVSAPVVSVNTPLENVVVEVNSPDTQIDLSNLFISNEDPPLDLTITLESNSNPTLMTASVNANTLTLSYMTDESGVATITLRAEDENQNFDTFSFSVTVLPPPASDFPYIENFDDGLFPEEWESSGAMSWLVTNIETPSVGTGPLTDHTQGNTSGYYTFNEATGFDEGDEAIFTTQSFDISELSNPILEFRYHMFGIDIGTLNVDVIDETNSTDTNIFTISGPQQSEQADPYLLGFASLSDFSNSQIKLKFTSIRGNGFASDIALDDVSILQGPDNDVAITDILIAPYSLINNENQVTIQVENRGGLAQSSIQVGYRLPNESDVIEVIDTSIQPGESLEFTFTSTYSIAEIGAYSLEAFVQHTGDENSDNDLLSFEGAALTTAGDLPYVESFESGAGNWLALENNNSFELGTPANTAINGASDGTQAWVTNLTGNYNSSETSTVVSPVFDFSTTTDPQILVDINFVIEESFDGAILQWSTDMGITWQNVGVLNDEVNWYNGTNFGSLGFAGESTDSWTGSSGGFVQASHALDIPAGSENTILRFAFGSDPAEEDEGFAFDNIRIVSSESLLELECVESIEVSNDTGDCEAAVAVAQPTITNATGNVVIVNSFNNTDNASDTYPVGITEVTWTVSDDVGIAKTCTTMITVIDSEAPVFSPLSDVFVEVASGITEVEVTYDFPSADENCPFEKTITQSGDQTLAAFNSIICPTGPNSYIRIFDFSEFGVTTDYVVESLDFGIEEAVATGGTQTATANLYSYDPNDALAFASFELIISKEVTISDGNLFLLNVPIDPVVIPGGTTVVMELVTLHGNSDPSLIMVGQPNGAEGVSYLTASACGINEPTDVDIAFGSDVASDWVMNINGGGGVFQTAGLGSGSLFPLGTTTEAFEALDLGGNTSAASFSVIVATSVLPAPVAVAADEIDYFKFRANWNATNEATGYRLDVSNDGFATFVTGYEDRTVTGTSETIEGLTPGETYQYRVRAADDDNGLSTNSNIIEVTTEDGLILSPIENQTGTSLTISWQEVSGASSYEIEVGLDDEFLQTISGIDPVTALSTEITGLAENTEHFVRVRATDGNAFTSFSNVESGSTLLNGPSSLVAIEETISSVSLSWVDNSLVEDGFVIERSVDETSFTQIGTSASNISSFLDETIENDISYFYRIAAQVDAITSEYSNVAEIIVSGVPEAPTELEATGSEGVGISLSWTDNADNEDTFVIERSDVGSGFSEIGTATANSESYLDDTALSDIEYSYRVAAQNNGVQSEYSNTASFTIIGTPAAPTNLEANASSADGIVLTWTDNANNEDGYVIERSTDDIDYSEIGTTSTNETMYVDATAVLGEEYFYRIAASNSDVLSDFVKLNVSFITGLNDDLLSKAIEVVPNPSQGIFSVKIDAEDLKQVKIKVWSLVGGLILERTQNRNAGRLDFSIDLTDRSGNVYFMLIQTGDGSSTVKKLLKN